MPIEFVGNRRVARGLAVVVTAAALLVLVSSASANKDPGVRWTSSRDATAAEAIPISWASSHLGKNFRLVVQRPVGTAHVFKTVLKLKGRSGSAQLPPQALGRYHYRLVALRGGRVLATKAVTIAVFGQVPFSALFHGAEESGLYSTSQNSFPYVLRWGFTGSDAVFKVKNNRCRSVHIEFVTADHDAGVVATISVVQETRDAVSASAAGDTIASLDAQLVPGQSWAVNASLAPNLLYEVYFNGYADCDSSEPLA